MSEKFSPSQAQALPQSAADKPELLNAAVDMAKAFVPYLSSHDLWQAGKKEEAIFWAVADTVLLLSLLIPVGGEIVAGVGATAKSARVATVLARVATKAPRLAKTAKVFAPHAIKAAHVCKAAGPTLKELNALTAPTRKANQKQAVANLKSSVKRYRSKGMMPDYSSADTGEEWAMRVKTKPGNAKGLTTPAI